MLKRRVLEKNKRLSTRVIIFALMLVLSLTMTYTAFAEDLQEELDGVNSEIEASKNEEERARAELQQIKDNIVVLEGKIAHTEAEIAATEIEISDATKEVERLAIEVANLEVEIDDENSNLNKRLKLMYQSNEDSVLVVLLSSENIIDFFANLDMIKLVHQSGADLIEELDRKLTEVELKKAEIERIKASLEEQKALQEERKVQLDADNATLASEKIRAEENVAAAVEHTKALEAESKKIEQELADRAAKAKAAAEAGYSSGVPFEYTGGQLNWPCQGRLTSGFGPRWGTIHQGIDIANAAGTPIYAAGDGEVFYAQWNSGGYGYQVRIDHGGGIVTTYAHCSSVVASPGQRVTRGTLIAYMGTTGNSTGNHCHFEVRVNGVATNPMGWL